ncbi:MAG: alpha/beta hydrolase [Actinomycetia bacterium]|nr:alpha/beta hydrolase [Actinomycetes bacterium]
MQTELVTSADGTRVAFHDLGGDGLPPVLFCHGNGLAGAMWLPVAERLAGLIRPILVDFRGHGSSDNEPSLDVHWDRIGEDLGAVVSQVSELAGPAPLFGVGHSLGGAILLRFEGQHPGTFAGLTVFEPIVLPPDASPPMNPLPIAQLARKRRMEFDSVDEMVERFSLRPPFNRCRSEAVRAYAEAGTRPTPDGRVRLACDGELEARIFESEHIDIWAVLDRVECPVLVLAGTTIDNRPSELAQPVSKALSKADFTRYDGLTHMGPMEDPDLLASIITSMIEPQPG